MHPLFSRFYYAYKVRPAGRFGYAADTGRPVRPIEKGADSVQESGSVLRAGPLL